MRRRDPGAALDDDVADTYVPAARADVCILGNSFVDLHTVVSFDNILDRDDDIGSLRHHAAGCDRHCFPATKRSRRRNSGRDPRNDRQPTRRVARTQGKAVHCGAGKGGQVHCGQRVPGEESTCRFPHGDRLCAEWFDTSEHASLGVREREQIGHFPMEPKGE